MYTNLTSSLLCGVTQNLTPISATQKSNISDSKTGIERRLRPQPEVNRVCTLSTLGLSLDPRLTDSAQSLVERQCIWFSILDGEISIQGLKSH